MSAVAALVGHFMQLEVTVHVAADKQPRVITSQINPLLHAQEKMVPPLDKEFGSVGLPH